MPANLLVVVLESSAYKTDETWGWRSIVLHNPNRFVDKGRQPFCAMNFLRNSIRDSCANLRKLLVSVKPDDTESVLQEVLTIECDALAADSDDLRTVEEKLAGLVRRLVEQGVIDAQRWKKFFGEAEW